MSNLGILPQPQHIPYRLLTPLTHLPIDGHLSTWGAESDQLLPFQFRLDPHPITAAAVPTSRRWTDAFVGLSTCGRHMSTHHLLGALARALEGVPAGHALTAELMAHPGYPSVPPFGGCGEGPDAFSCSWERLHELRVLTAPTLSARLAQDGVQLCALDSLDSKRRGDGVPCEATLDPFLQPSPP